MAVTDDLARTMGTAADARAAAGEVFARRRAEIPEITAAGPGGRDLRRRALPGGARTRPPPHRRRADRPTTAAPATTTTRRPTTTAKAVDRRPPARRRPRAPPASRPRREGRHDDPGPRHHHDDPPAVTGGSSRVRSFHVAPAGVDVVDDPVGLGLLGGEPAVALGVLLDLLDGLAGVLGDALGHAPLDVLHPLGLDGDVGGLALDAAERLVHEDLGVGQGEALARGAGAQQELAHRGAEAHADGGHVRAARTASCRRWPCRR